MDLDERVTRLEERMARVEARLRYASHGVALAEPRPAETPASPAIEIPEAAPAPALARREEPSVAPRPRPSRPAPRRAQAGKAPASRGVALERFLGVAVLGRVGIAALLAAAAWFGQLGYQELAPWARVAA